MSTAEEHTVRTFAGKVVPARLDAGNLLPKNYAGDLRTFVMVDDEAFPQATGAMFGDGRLVVSSLTGHQMRRYEDLASLVNDWYGDGFMLWAIKPYGPADYDTLPRRFILRRHRDATGTSGTGIACEGVRFPHGGVVLMWLGEIRSLVEWPSIEEALAIHGHGDDTVLEWLDGDTDD